MALFTRGLPPKCDVNTNGTGKPKKRYCNTNDRHRSEYLVVKFVLKFRKVVKNEQNNILNVKARQFDFWKKSL